MDTQRFNYLFNKFLDKSLSPAELEELRVLAKAGDDEVHFKAVFDAEWDQAKTEQFTDVPSEKVVRMYEHIVGQSSPKVKMRQLWPRIAAAASIILCLGTGAYFYFHQKVDQQQTAQNKPVKNDLLPGGNRAYLTLSNGKRITLTGAANGQIAQQSGVTITKTADGQLVYQAASAGTDEASAPIKYNTIETPKGGQYQVTLPDGTAVWLNAASSLKYPASFASLKDRKVELTGEAYFEVAKDKAHPFIVKTNNEDVEVLGTHFNINSYTDEPSTKTTLLEGSVQVSAKEGDIAKIKPGEQAVLNQSGNIAVEKVNVNKAVAWKNGKFVFESENISSIMRKLSRWYDVEIVYKDDIPDRTFTGSISRYDNISKILENIMLTKAIHFKIEGRRITIMR
jgi:hypothetical protein